MELSQSRQENLLSLLPAEPLWQRVPTRDDEGHLLGDFMMIIPRLNALSTSNIQQTISKLNKLFALYHEWVVFADLNLKMNVLWISHKQRSGLGLELAAAIHACIPEAKLVAQRYEQ